VITYVPAFTVSLFIVIVKPGPTAPVSVFAFVAANVELASASVARIVVRPTVVSRTGSSLVSRVNVVADGRLRAAAGGRGSVSG
jgi:hypothetical protein